MLKVGDELRHFTATTLDGRSFRYKDIWQNRNLVLISVPGGSSLVSPKRLNDWRTAAGRASGDDTVWVITADPVQGFDGPVVVVADQWGEVHHVQVAESADNLPGGDDLAQWIEFVRHQCPECQGEAK